MLDKTIVKNISSLFSIRVAGYIIPLITLPYLVRVLEPIGYGKLGFCLAIIQYFIIAVNYGFDLSATQKIAQSNDDKLKLSLIFWNVIAVRVLISLAGLILLFLLSIIFENIASLLPTLLCAYVAVFAAALFPQWLFQGKEQLGTISIIRIVLQVIQLPFLFLYVKSTEDIWLAALLSSMPSLIIVAFSVCLIGKRHWITWGRPSLGGMKKELQDGWYLFLSTAAIGLYTTSTTVILGIIAGPVSVAIYISANKLLQAAQGIYSPISASFYPRINNLMSKNKTEALEMIRYLMKVQTAITFGISICLFIFAPYVVNLLFGPEFERSSSVLRIMSVLPIIIGLSNIFGVQVLLSYGYKKEFSTILLISGSISLVTLIPLCYFYQSEGAAISVVITEFIVTALMLKYVLSKKIPLFKRVMINEI
ncbi:flippase [Paraglaciecola psychrophila]|uniref:Polysaccharide biosynthesis protein n=1 Tax=Paraglaciecola psychrophila 170 TaxID=1129794 RepID=K7AKG2_9ALTE|nr:flippase [Paraglaciecola psychrophila]AGH43743.1 polysaccharide biosynthesis protein [Paraglaciecola psychrophila 170]GAC35950.1 wzx protein [Paraglaciecola psychrophila 170]